MIMLCTRTLKIKFCRLRAEVKKSKCIPMPGHVPVSLLLKKLSCQSFSTCRQHQNKPFQEYVYLDRNRIIYFGNCLNIDVHDTIFIIINR